MSRDFRLHVLGVGSILAYGFLASASNTAAASVRFLVGELGEPVHHDSYVLPLSDPAAIAHARDLISIGPSAGEAIVVAAIAAGGNGINRNYLAPGAPSWSWHVSEFLGFADNTIEILDGWPTYVESDVQGWIENTSGMIGFWRYTVVAELPRGDYNADLQVGAADYVVWRDSLGSTTNLAADGDGDGSVDAGDFAVWTTHFGQTVGSGSGASAKAAVAEPATALLMLLVGIFAMSSRRRAVVS